MKMELGSESSWVATFLMASFCLRVVVSSANRKERLLAARVAWKKKGHCKQKPPFKIMQPKPKWAPHSSILLIMEYLIWLVVYSRQSHSALTPRTTHTPGWLPVGPESHFFGMKRGGHHQPSLSNKILSTRLSISHTHFNPFTPFCFSLGWHFRVGVHPSPFTSKVVTVFIHTECVCESERGIEQKHHATFYMLDGIFSFV